MINNLLLVVVIIVLRYVLTNILNIKESFDPYVYWNVI